MNLTEIIAQSERLIRSSDQYEITREVINQLLVSKDRTLVGLNGARGSGKTVLLKQLSRRLPETVFIPVDSLDYDRDIFEVVRELAASYGYKNFLLDEIHFNHNINRSLKLIYDQLRVKVFFTSSIAIAMQDSAHDLSRRLNLVPITSFSFREFLLIKEKRGLLKLSFPDLFDPDRTEYAKFDYLFAEYLDGGCLPFSLEVEDWRHAQQNIIDKIITHDLPQTQNFSFIETQEAKKILDFLLLNSGSEHNPTSLSKRTEIARHRVFQYLDCLEKSYLITQLWPAGKNLRKEPKIHLKLPLRALNLDLAEAIGGLREDFAVESLINAGLQPRYLKTKRGSKTPDFYVNYQGQKYVLEVGGKNKDLKQFKGIDTKFQKYVFKDGAPYNEVRRPLVNLGGLY